MTGIKIVCVGRVKEDFFRDGIAAYVKEIRKKYSMDIMECSDEPTPDQCPASVERQIREMEGERILSKIKDDDYVIALCIDVSVEKTDGESIFYCIFRCCFCNWRFIRPCR